MRRDLDSEPSIEIVSARFLLRPLAENDATERYLSWLRDAHAARFISTAIETQTLGDLRRYIASRCGRDDVLFLGIFEKGSGRHIGNVKFEPIVRETAHAVMGILIGEPDYRGRDVAREVLDASVAWLGAHRGVREIVLGVSADNPAAIRAYEKAGFAVAQTAHLPNPPNGVLTMVRCLAA
jgi:RimJ/RimL family protein N-acetyltransferase